MLAMNTPNIKNSGPTKKSFVYVIAVGKCGHLQESCIQTLLVVWDFVWFYAFHFYFAIYLFAAVSDRCLASLSIPLRGTSCIKKVKDNLVHKAAFPCGKIIFHLDCCFDCGVYVYWVFFVSVPLAWKMKSCIVL